MWLYWNTILESRKNTRNQRTCITLIEMKFSSLFFYLLTKKQRMENGKQVVDGNLEGIKKSLEGSLKRLKTDYIDLYYLHRVDPNVPIEDIAYLMKDFIKQGKIKHWGLSEAGIETKPMQYVL
ncbi:aldo/keto reductase [Faecalibacillus intestinalis]|uniref:aldo/keto reductase n=2 Tax=Faecalibacillus intestinalis TaxID=1982626 RepID=UPI002E770417|nr:aldo/keto reductase [Faecalibacillus intestinalis]MED9807924.1 aldo/keto reductase [Faecalibacillus intestinalis]